MTQSSVNSYSEWSPLREVVVGRPFTDDPQELDLSFRLFFYDNAFQFFDALYAKTSRSKANQDEGIRRPSSLILKQRYLDELSEDIEGLVATLRSAGVNVLRPEKLVNGIKEFSTPYWQSSTWPALNVRDRAIIFGDEILETTPCIRGRYFETDLLKKIFYGYFRAGSRWTQMPRPIMTDNSFDTSYIDSARRHSPSSEAIYEPIPSPHDVGHEIMIDAANCVRFGYDVLINVANENQALGFSWLERHLSGRFKLHKVVRMADNHIDSFILPLRPGLLLLRHPKVREMLPKALQKWDAIYPPEPQQELFPTYEDDDLVLASQYIDLNVLSIDENTVIANALNPGLLRVLESRGLTVMPVRHRHRRLFGGGFHCFTLDTIREGGHENYFD